MRDFSLDERDLSWNSEGVSIREAQLALTRQRILETFLEASHGPDAKRTSVAEVARRSGISQATIYRHFPNRDALVSAAANHRIPSAPEHPATWGLHDFDAHLRQLWTDLAGNLRVAREGVHSDAGREMRVARFRSLHAELVSMLEAAGLDTTTPAARHLIAAIALVTSAAAFLDMHDRQGLSPDEAVDVAMWTARRLLEAAGIDPATFRRINQPHDEEAS